MGVVTAPWCDLVLFLRSITESGSGDVFPLWISAFVLFVSVGLILLQLIVFFTWKLTQVEASMDLKTSATSRPNSRSADWRSSSL